MKELQGKNVVVALGTTNFSNVVKGDVLDVSDGWLKIQTKKTLEFIRVDAIIKISVP
ncbi:DUF6897 domain-containing protein [Oceanospirillum maris]|uniref:DUF6897 domain-containing protein n=1 Tax=Oceanospirillum maris TaxID=64977 RepID=UPI0012FEBE92|nr:hypothetical protein [Oceanospirillum maris]